MIPHINRALAFLAVLTAPILVSGQAETGMIDAPTTEARTIPLLNAEQLDELLGPIALYPDALIALLLPACTMPTDLVLAARYLAAGGDGTKVDDQPWDESVRGLAHYPEVVKWMDEKLSWSIMVGDAFIAQPVDVMQSIQRLRARARAAGTLVDSTEQKVVEEEQTIRIVPARPEVIYVPYYDPQVVYVPRPAWSWGWYPPVVTYPWCYPTGIWMSYDCDWYHSRVWVVNTHWRHHWYHDHGWYKPYHHRYQYHYGNHDYGHGWSPHHGRGGHPDARRGGRDRPTHVVIRDGHREDDRSSRPGNFAPRPDGNHNVVRGGDDNSSRGRTSPGERGSPDVRAGGGERNPDRGTSYVDGRDGNRNGGRAPGGDRSDRAVGGERRGANPDTRGAPTTSPDRQRPNSPRVVANPGTPRVTPPATSPRVTPTPAVPRTPVAIPRSSPVVGHTEPKRTTAPSPGRWIDRATNPGNAPQVRAETPRSRPAPSAPRVAPSERAPERTTTVNAPVSSRGSRPVEVSQPPAAERSTPPPSSGGEARASRPGRGEGGGGGGGERSSGRAGRNGG